jgi:murein DD-endopeptidase MepM/ murein hydrolase activator NlpD
MTSSRWFYCLSPVLGLLVALQSNTGSNQVLAQAAPCPQPALSRLVRHQVKSGETLESLARQYNLIPATLMGLNPAVRNGKAPVGAEILIPPYNGIRVEVPAGKRWQDIAAAYKVRADVLFEVNGCQRSPKVVFVPGVNWSPQNPSSRYGSTSTGGRARDLTRYPLPATAPVILGYGWRLNPATGQVAFNSGIGLKAATGTSVLAVGDGIVAFAGKQGNYGNLVVVNHQQGRQTRYAHLNTMAVKVGQKVKSGAVLGTVGTTGTVNEPQLHFEVRSASNLGWVAEDPTPYLGNLSGQRN